MPVALSGVMFVGRTLYSAVSQTCGPPAWRFAVSSTPFGPRGVWQLPQVRIPSTRYLPRSTGACAPALVAATAMTASQSLPRMIPPCSMLLPDADISFVRAYYRRRLFLFVLFLSTAKWWFVRTYSLIAILGALSQRTTRGRLAGVCGTMKR